MKKELASYATSRGRRNGIASRTMDIDKISSRRSGVDLAHEASGFDEDSDDTTIVGYIFIRECAAFAIFEPFLRRLVAADIHIPSFAGDIGEILGGVDADDTDARIRFGRKGREVHSGTGHRKGGVQGGAMGKGRAMALP